MSWFRRRNENASGKQIFRLGDTVRIKAGPFAAFTGKIEGINQAKQLLKIILSIFDQTKTVKVKFSEVERVGAS